MAQGDPAPLPSIGEALGPLLQELSAGQQPLFIALAERMAAERYRVWAKSFAGRPDEARLIACAEREEEIARRVEALHPDAAALQRELRAAHPGLDGINRRLFEGRPLAQQLAIQAKGERLGAATWRALAKNESNGVRRSVLLECATLEEESALVLEAILDGQP